MSQRIFLVDAFASAPFTGNPAAVVPLESPLDAATMQALAMEMNQAETAFPLRTPTGWELRWFTPMAEVDLCGHATLASAHALFMTGAAEPREPLVFRTRSGELVCRKRGDRISMDFPALSVVEEESPAARTLFPAATFIGRSRFDRFVVVPEEELVRAYVPDHAAIAAMGDRGLILTARGRDHDCVSRFFAPGVGVPEDPVTGSAHCALGPYWSRELGKTELVGYQASRRGGEVCMIVRGDRIDLSGQARVVVEGLVYLG